MGTRHQGRHRLLFVAILWILQSVAHTTAQPYIGVNYGDLADNLPSPSDTAALLASTTISKLRLYSTNAALATAIAAGAPGVSLLLGVPNGDVPSLANSPSAAAAWVAANIPASPPISAVAVGNELLNSGDSTLPPLLVPAMENLLAALPPNSTVKISSVHSMAVLSSSDPPSSGAFHPDLDGALDPVLAFLRRTGAPFMINPYPYFAYISDPRPETLAFCLFQPNPNRVDSASGLTYTNMFDAQLDAVRAALDAKGYTDVAIVVAETGWPYRGDANEVGATVDNARAYVGNLVTHLRSAVGTPRVPGKVVDTYIFALYDEDQKPGPTSERSFGLYAADRTPNYDAGLLKTDTGTAAAATNGTSATPSPTSTQGAGSTVAQPVTPTGWCLTTAGTQAQSASTCYLPAGGILRHGASARLWPLGVGLAVLWLLTPMRRAVTDDPPEACT